MIDYAPLVRFMTALLALSTLTACSSSLPPEGRAIAATSERIRAAFVATHEAFYSQPRPIKMRYNSCLCDENLQFDAQLFGQWQRISLSASPNILQDLINSAQALPPGTPFDVPVIIRSTRSYTSDNNQHFYLFEYSQGR